MLKHILNKVREFLNRASDVPYLSVPLWKQICRCGRSPSALRTAPIRR